MGNSITSTILNRAASKQSAVLLLLAASVLSSTTGCLPEVTETVFTGPPQEEQVFTDPPAGSEVPFAPLTVYLDPYLTEASELGLGGWQNEPTVCFTTNGLDPIWDNGSCFGNGGAAYNNLIGVNCDGQEGEVVKTVKVLYQWDEGAGEGPQEHIVATTFTINCEELPAEAIQFTLTQTGTVVAAVAGEIIAYRTGQGVFDPTTGSLNFIAYIESETAKDDPGSALRTKSRTDSIIELQGTWDEGTGVLSNISGTSETIDCDNLLSGGLGIDPCQYVVGYPTFDQGETTPYSIVGFSGSPDLTNLIEFDTSSGAVNTFTQYYIANPGDLFLEAFTWTDYVLTNK